MNGGSITYPDAETKKLEISGSLAPTQAPAGSSPLDNLYALLAKRAMSRNNRGVNNIALHNPGAAPGVLTDPLTKAFRQNQMNADLSASNMDLARMRQKMGPYVFNSNRPPLS